MTEQPKQPKTETLWQTSDGEDRDKTKVDQILTDVHRLRCEGYINDLKKAVEFPYYLPLIVAGIILICTIAGYFGYKYLKKLRKARANARPWVPPWIEAIVAIENIPIKEWLEKGLVKKYYYALSEILKQYIERRFEFNAAEQTTTEIIAHLKLQKIPLRDDFDRFSFDSGCDLFPAHEIGKVTR